MNTLQIFNFEGMEIRTVTINGEPCFVAKDIALSLGYAWQGNLINHVPAEWKGVNPINTLGGIKEMSVLSEQGLYFFLGRSDKEKALPFQKWIAGDVLPAIRKTGGYIPVTENDTDDDIMAKALVIAHKTLDEKSKRIAEMKPKAEYFDALVDRNLLTNFRDTAKEFKIQQNHFIEWLLEKGYIFRDKKNKIKPYASSMEKGLFEIKEWATDHKTGTQTMNNAKRT